MLGFFKAIRIMNKIQTEAERLGISQKLDQEMKELKAVGPALNTGVTPPMGMIAAPQMPGQLLQATGAWQPPTNVPQTDPSQSSKELLSMLAMRMRWTDLTLARGDFAIVHPFKHIGLCDNHDGSMVLVFIVTSDGHLVIEDEAAMFPSDKLVTKLRVLTP